MTYLLMAHQNEAKVDNGTLTVDRKFHVGMVEFAKSIVAPILTVNPTGTGDPIMDPIQVPVGDLPYKISTIKVDRARSPLASEMADLKRLVAASKLVYGDGLDTAALARASGIPYIPILEYDLQTQTTVALAGVTNPIRRAVKIVRTALSYRKSLGSYRRAHSLHCNGYPIFDAMKPYNAHSLLYLDSRMARDMVLSRAALEARLNSRVGPLKLLYSGRYEQMKGSADAVQVGLECLRRGLDVEMHCYGQGSLKAEMLRLAGQSAGKIIIHDAVPYAELVNISRGFDVFVCCHIQSDPSCTYLESYGAGLPIVGYANRMWQRLRDESQAGLASAIGKPEGVADHIGRLVTEPELLATFSRRALAFATDHCYENEWTKRIDAINAAITG